MESARAPQHLNEYRFTTLRALRECLRSYASLISLARSGDFTSAATMLDLSIAMGDDPMRGVTVLTVRQKQAISLHLIRDQHVNDVAAEMGVNPRVVYLLVNNGLRRLLKYLQYGALPEDWQQWQIDYVRRNAGRPRKELAAHVGRSHDAVRVLIYRLRKQGETIERSGRRTSCSGQTRERRSA